MTTQSSAGTMLDRRTFLGATAAATVGTTALGASARTASASSGPALADWLADVDNYDGVVDERGSERVTVTVGANGNGGAFAFGPAAVRVDPGTTVVWRWTGQGGMHNAVATDGSFESPLLTDAGETFAHTFEAEGIVRYSCVPHEAMGMKGAVVVGDVPVGAGTNAGAEPEYGDWFDGVDNFEGTVDAMGQSEVRILVGAAGNGGAFAFDPAAVHIDPGTTVVWEWTGDGGAHNVYDASVGYESDMLSAEGATFALTFEGEGTSKYACAPHEAMGMRGAVVVGPVGSGTIHVSEAALGVGGAVLAALLSPLAFWLLLHFTGTGRKPSGVDGPPVTARPDQPADSVPGLREQPK